MTIISNSHKFVFVHLHKCGGSSVEAAYEPLSRWDDLILSDVAAGGQQALDYYRKRRGLHKHNPARDLKRKLNDVWDEYWTFALVRHPARVYESYYRWMDRDVTKLCENRQLQKRDVVDLARKGELAAKLIDRQPFWPFILSQDFNDFVFRFYEAGRLATMFNRLSDGSKLLVDNVYKLEASGQFWSDFSERLGVEVPATHNNKGASKTETPWSDEAIALVNTFHAVDYEQFGYSPEGSK